MTLDQAAFDIRCEWGMPGVTQLAPISDVIIIIDVFSFTTCVEIAVNRGVTVFPYGGSAEYAADFAHSVNAELATKWGGAGYSLSPHSLVQAPAGLRLVLPSPNGSTLSLGTGQTPTIAGCLRNYTAVATAASTYGRKIAVIPAGERWRADGSLRPAYEDWLGAGAIISQLRGRLSPEARAARAAFLDAQAHLGQFLGECPSGQEHVERGVAENVTLAAALNCSTCVPLLVDKAYQRVQHKTEQSQ